VTEQWKEIEAEWLGEGAFIGRNVSGGTVQFGRLGDKPCVSPMELILVGLAGCTGSDVVDILKKKREPLKALKVQVRGKRAEEYPKIYTEIEITYLIWGVGIDTKSIERAIQLSESTFSKSMLSSVADIRSTYTLFNSDMPDSK
jgi:putative redox protein